MSLLTDVLIIFFFFFKQKTAYEMRISDWSSDVCSSDLTPAAGVFTAGGILVAALFLTPLLASLPVATLAATIIVAVLSLVDLKSPAEIWRYSRTDRSEEHTSELQSLMRISYAVFCLKKKNQEITRIKHNLIIRRY